MKRRKSNCRISPRVPNGTQSLSFIFATDQTSRWDEAATCSIGALGW